MGQQIDPRIGAALAAIGAAVGLDEASVAATLGDLPTRVTPTASSPRAKREYSSRVDQHAQRGVPVPRKRARMSTAAQRNRALKEIQRQERASRMERRIAYLASVRARGADRFEPDDLPGGAIGGMQYIMGARAAGLERRIRELPRRYADTVRDVATRGGTIPIDSIHARKTIAVACLLYLVARPTRRRGMTAVVEGLSRGMIASAIRCPATGRPYSIAAIYHRTNGSSSIGTYGPVPALADAGAFLCVQPPADVADPRTVGPSGYALMQYWFGGGGAGARALEPPEPPD